MSSLYYTVKRTTPLLAPEIKTIQEIIDKYNSEYEIEGLVKAGSGDLFSVNQSPKQTGVILDGATELPSVLFPDRVSDFMYVVENWFSAISELRNNIKADEWVVTLDDKPLQWNTDTSEYQRPAA